MEWYYPGLEEGMILSDEPGYYEDGKFGIRIESLVKIVKAEPKYSSSGKNNKNNTWMTICMLML